MKTHLRKTRDDLRGLFGLLLLVSLLVVNATAYVGCGCVPKPPPPVVVVPPVVVKPVVTAVTYIYEKDDTAIPTGVLTAIDRLNREKNLIATMIDDDVTDGTGEVPEQYKSALAAAKEAGLPAAVATAGHIVVKVVKNPQTEAETMAAAE